MKTKNIFRMLLVAAALLMGANIVKATETTVWEGKTTDYYSGDIQLSYSDFTSKGLAVGQNLRVYASEFADSWSLNINSGWSQSLGFNNWKGQNDGITINNTNSNAFDNANGYFEMTIGEDFSKVENQGFRLQCSGLYVTKITLSSSGGGTQTGPVDVTVSFDPSSLSIKCGQTVTPTITATANNTTVTGLTYTYISGSNAIATVSDAGAVTGVGIGNTTITVSWAAIPGYYTSGSATYNVTVGKADASILFSNNNVELTFGESFTPPTATTTPAYATVTYTTSDANIVYQKADGSLVPVGEGTATITGSIAESTYYTATSGTYTLNVTAPTRTGAAWNGAAWLGNYAQHQDNDDSKPVVGTQPNIPANLFSAAKVGDAIRFYGKLGPLSNTYWRVETHGNNWATLGESEGNDGFANGYFNMAITADNIDVLKASENLILNGYNLTITAAELITASAPAKQDVTLAFTPTSATATMGQSFTAPTLTATSNGQTVTLTGITYSSSDTSVATIDASTGDVRLVAAGTTIITASLSNDNTYNDASASYTLTVNPAAPNEEDYIDVSEATTLNHLARFGYRTYVTTETVDFSRSIGVEAYYATRLNGTVVEFTQVPNTCPKGVALLLKAKNGATEFKLLKSNASNVSDPTNNNNLLRAGNGSTVSGDDKYVLTYHNGIVFAKTNNQSALVDANHAYLDLSGSNAGGRLRIKLNGESTGISSLQSDERSLDGAVYNLRGQRVEHPTKGIYIINGKKVVIK